MKKPATGLSRRQFLTRAIGAGVAGSAAGVGLHRAIRSQNTVRLNVRPERLSHAAELTTRFSSVVLAAAPEEVEGLRKEMARLNNLTEKFFRDRGMPVPQFELNLERRGLITFVATNPNQEIGNAVTNELSRILLTEGKKAVEIQERAFRKAADYWQKQEAQRQSRTERGDATTALGGAAAAFSLVFGVPWLRKKLQERKVRQAMPAATMTLRSTPEPGPAPKQTRESEVAPRPPEQVRKKGNREERISGYIADLVARQNLAPDRLEKLREYAISKRIGQRKQIEKLAQKLREDPAALD